MSKAVLIDRVSPASAPPVAPVSVPDAGEPEVSELGLAEKLALLQMSSRVSVQAVYFALRERESLPPFSLSTFARLRELGLCERKPGQRFHSLTGDGAFTADLIARAMVRDREIHSAWIGGSVGATTTLHCTCGWSCGLARGTGMQLKAARAHSYHLATLAALKASLEKT